MFSIDSKEKETSSFHS